LAFDRKRSKWIAPPEPATDMEKQKQQDDETEAKNTDVSGDLYVKAEWKNNGPRMPPIKSENLFKKAKIVKNRKVYNDRQTSLMLLKQLYIDVNDPRNQKVIKLLRETKNEYLASLLKEDSRNLVSNLTPFRHKLIQARYKDPAFLEGKRLPMLEKEIVNSSINDVFIKKLEKLYQEAAFQQYLSTRARMKDDTEVAKNMMNNHDMKDQDALKRKQVILDRIKDR
jgi:hypothetical protein